MKRRSALQSIISGSLLIAGTTIGAGMLGIPLLTSQAGFLPAVLVTLLVWIFMAVTGILFLEATLWMPDGSNVLSMAKRYLNWQGKFFCGGMYIFLYYCLMIAYFAAGAPIFMNFLESAWGIGSYHLSYLIFGLVFGGLVFSGLKWIDRVNFILIIAMILSFIFLLSMGSGQIEADRLLDWRWSSAFFTAPVLFSSFGYHNVIPSLCTYFRRDVKLMKWSIWIGTSLPFLFYLLWQWLIIGAFNPETIEQVLQKGQPVTEAFSLGKETKYLIQLGRVFGFFAVVTSMLGVSFSLVDFMADAFKISRKGFGRLVLCLIVFVPPFIFASIDPTIFVKAIGIAGGFGEAFLNGMMPVLFVWVGRYTMKLKSKASFFDNKMSLALLFFLSLVVVVLEIINLVFSR